MKGLKIAVAALSLVVAGLAFTVYRLSQQRSGFTLSAPGGGTAPSSASAASAPAPASGQSEAAPAVPAELPKPSPVEPKRRVTQLRRPRATPTAEPAEFAQSAPPPPAPVAEPQPSPAAPLPAQPVVPQSPATPPPPPAPHVVTIPAGTALLVRTQNAISTQRSLTGDTFTATLDAPLVAGGYAIAERGAEVEGRIVRSQRAGRIEGVSELQLELTSVRTSDGQRLSISTGLYETKGETSHKADAEKVGIGAGLGAIIGAIAGGGKGAAIGAGAGGAAGAGTVAATRGKDVSIPSETRLRFDLRAPVTVTERR